MKPQKLILTLTYGISEEKKVALLEEREVSLNEFLTNISETLLNEFAILKNTINASVGDIARQRLAEDESRAIARQRIAEDESRMKSRFRNPTRNAIHGFIRLRLMELPMEDKTLEEKKAILRKKAMEKFSDIPSELVEQYADEYLATIK